MGESECGWSGASQAARGILCPQVMHLSWQINLSEPPQPFACTAWALEEGNFVVTGSLGEVRLLW